MCSSCYSTYHWSNFIEMFIEMFFPLQMIRSKLLLCHC